MPQATEKKKSAWDRARLFIPNGCQTLSKCPSKYVNGVYPKMLVSGRGADVYDEEGKKYIDYIASLGAILIGHSSIAVDNSVTESITNGEVLLSLPHPKEGELAEKICRIMGYEMVKFFKTGSEATSAAVRLARAYTGHDAVLMCGYNGWHDWAGITYDRNAGIPKPLARYTGKFKYNDLASLETLFRTIGPTAAVILEPTIYEEPEGDFLKEVIRLAHMRGALVIFDEVVTGLRFGFHGAGGLFGVEPDIACIGKALGNGYAISALAGKSKYMEVFERDDFIASGTFSGELIGISAALAVLDILNPAMIWESGSILKTGFNGLCADMGLPDVSCVGYAPRTQFKFPTDAHKALFWQECVKRGVLFGYTNFAMQNHATAQLQETLNVCRDALKKVKKSYFSPEVELEGEMPKWVVKS